MRIEKIILENFGPFRRFEMDFPKEEGVSLLLVGKNNEGKSTILRALKILYDSTKVIGKAKYQTIINGDPYYTLLKQDVGDIRIGRLIYNYRDDISKIIGLFSDGFEITAYLDSQRDIIYADYIRKLPTDINSIFGFIPPLGPIAEHEEVLSNLNYVKANINTSLAPRHLRNYYHQLLTNEQFQLVKKIVETSWANVELDSHDLIKGENRLECFYKEDGILREISWAGQGLQIWFQIITHLVLLLDRKILILDEPEVNLHPEKQNELISIIRQYFSGSVIIATHSIELMNNVNISHIINIKKHQNKPSIKIAADRKYLEEVRASIGSNFNFIASQFEEVDYLIFTEDADDYKIFKNLLEADSIVINDFNIPIHGFQQWPSAIYYKNSYSYFIGKSPKCIVILDRDYYPEEYFLPIREKLNQNDISLVLTPGKEIENIYIFPEMYKPILSSEDYDTFTKWFSDMIEEYKAESFADYTGIYLKICKSDKEKNTVIKEAMKNFETSWNIVNHRYELIPGKNVLKKIRRYFQQNHSLTLTNNYLTKLLIQDNQQSKIEFIKVAI